MVDQHGKGNGKVVRGQDERTPLTPEDEPGDDLAGIRADDALLDALGGRVGDQDESLVDDELNALLLAWRREVHSKPVGELVDVDTAAATIAAARPQQRGRHRFLIPLASAAAILAIAFTGVSLVARDALPGDTLWGLTKVLYSEHARSVEAAVAVRTDLDTARAALRDGRVDEARDLLDKAGASLPSISADDGKADLTQTHTSLMQELTSTPAPTSTPSTPPPAPSTTLTTTPPKVEPQPTTIEPTVPQSTTPPTTTNETTVPALPSGTQSENGARNEIVPEQSSPTS